MARIQRDREDLLAEATALVQRIELQLPAFADPVIVGFRANGCGSVYFGQDLAYQFSSNGELRRAHDEGILYKAERRALVRLERRRGPQSVELVREALDPVRTEQFMAGMTTHLATLRDALARGEFSIIRQVPAEVDIVPRLRDWLEGLTPAKIAASPHAR
jgi:hypothetical protein